MTRKRKVRDSMWDSHEEPAVVTDDERHHLYEHGYLLVSGLLTPKQLRDVVTTLSSSNPDGNCDIEDERLGCLWHHPRVLALVDSVLGADFHLDGFYGRRAQTAVPGKLHTDWKGPVGDGPYFRCLAVFPLDPFRANNGANADHPRLAPLD